MKSNATSVLGIILVLSLALNFFLIRGDNKISDDTFIIPDVVTIVDTTTYLNVKDSVIIRYDTTELVTVTNDTVNIIVPITQKKFSTANYTAYVSGYKPNLDSLFMVFTPAPIKIVTKKRRRWSLGIQGGCTIGVNGFYPYVGVGIQYTIIWL